MNLYADTIVQSVTMKQVCEMYGIQINGSGFACCPFHGEKTPSLKIFSGNKGYYCFGCHAGGDVINFVEKYFNLDFMGAVSKINSDFCLNLPVSEKPSLREQTRFNERVNKINLEKSRMEALQENYDRALAKFVKADRTIIRCKPSSPEEEPNPEFIDAIKNIDYYVYKMNDAEARLYDEIRRQSDRKC